MFYRSARAALVVYDITSAESFEQMKSWVETLKRNIETHVGESRSKVSLLSRYFLLKHASFVVVVIIGNKTDLSDQRAVPVEVSNRYASSIDALLFETSAFSFSGSLFPLLKPSVSFNV